MNVQTSKLKITSHKTEKPMWTANKHRPTTILPLPSSFNEWYDTKHPNSAGCNCKLSSGVRKFSFSGSAMESLAILQLKVDSVVPFVVVNVACDSPLHLFDVLTPSPSLLLPLTTLTGMQPTDDRPQHTTSTLALWEFHSTSRGAIAYPFHRNVFNLGRLVLSARHSCSS